MEEGRLELKHILSGPHSVSLPLNKFDIKLNKREENVD